MTPSPDELFTRLAVSLGFVPAARAEAALAAARADGKDVAEILLAQGALLPGQAKRVRACLAAAAEPATTGAETVFAQDEGTLGAETLGSASPTDRPPTPPPADGGRYEILAELGRGGMGVVYRARDRGLGRTVALKILSGGEHASVEEVERFHREARAAARLRHSGIVEVYEVGRLDGRPYIAMAHVDGLPLDRHVIAHPALDLRARVDLLRRVAEAVDHAHAHGVIHRDLKPANILVDSTGQPQVADFGLAKEVAAESSASPITRSGAVLGTPQFMSPEQAAGDNRHTDARSDVYSLGAILYWLLAGRAPFEAATLYGVLNQVLNDWPAPPSRHRHDVPGDLDAVCLRALEKDRTRRYPTAAALAADLARFVAGEPVSARPITVWRRAGRRVARHPLLWAAGASVALLVSVLAASALRTEQARARAESGEAAAVEALRNAALVSRVLSRWHALQDTVRGLESSFYDSTLDPASCQATGQKGWPVVAAFIAETPDDPASRAAARALAGWARRLAGFPDEGIAWMREASTLEPQLALGPLLEALVSFTDYVHRLHLPTVVLLPGAVEFRPLPPESGAQIELRARIEALLTRTESLRLWGREGAEDFRQAIEGMRALQEERFDHAVDALTRALAAPDLRFVETSLRLARAKALYLCKRFDEALQDLHAVRVVRPSQADLAQWIGLFDDARATEAASRGADPRELQARAIDSYSAALKMRAEAATYDMRGSALQRRGEEEALRGADPRASFAQAVADHTEALRLDPNLFTVRLNRGNARVGWADFEADLGVDPRPRLREAIEDFAAALAGRPEYPEACNGRATALRSLGVADAMRGGDPRDTYQQALDDCDRALRSNPRLWVTWSNRANIGLALAKAVSDRGLNGRPHAERAVADAGEAIAIAPQVADLRTTRGTALMLLAELEARAGLDPRATLHKSLADQDQAVAARPGQGPLVFNRGMARWLLAKAERKHGGDPRPTLAGALADFDEAARIAPNLWNVHAGRGMLLESIGDLIGAIAAFEEVVRLNPAHTKMRAALDGWRTRLAEQSKAWLAEFARAEELSGKGETGAAREAWDRGVTAFERTLQLLPDELRARRIADLLADPRWIALRQTLGD